MSKATKGRAVYVVVNDKLLLYLRQLRQLRQHFCLRKRNAENKKLSQLFQLSFKTIAAFVVVIIGQCDNRGGVYGRIVARAIGLSQQNEENMKEI